MYKKSSPLVAVRPIKLEFANNENLSASIVGGSFFYIRECGFAVFLLSELDEFTLCIGHGNFHTGNIIRSFDRICGFKERNLAEKALQAVEHRTLEYLNRLSDELYL